MWSADWRFSANLLFCKGLLRRSLWRQHAQPKLALPRGGPPQRTSRLFIARIPPSVTEEQFRQYFESFGCVQVSALADTPKVFANIVISCSTLAQRMLTLASLDLRLAAQVTCQEAYLRMLC